MHRRTRFECNLETKYLFTHDGKTYSGFCPTSIIANSGASSPANALLICGKASRTSGHQGCLVIGSDEDMKAMNNFESGLSASSFTELGNVKYLVIGILAALDTVRT